MRSDAKKRFCLLLFDVSVVTRPALRSSQRVTVENRPCKSNTHEHLQISGWQTFHSTSNPLKASKNLGQPEKTLTEFTVPASGTRLPHQQRETLFGAHA